MSHNEGMISAAKSKDSVPNQNLRFRGYEAAQVGGREDIRPAAPGGFQYVAILGVVNGQDTDAA